MDSTARAEPLSTGLASLPGLWPPALRDFLDLGGPVVWILMAMAAFALAIVLLKAWQFRQLNSTASRDAEAAVRAWSAGRRDHARRLVSDGGAFATTLKVAMNGQVAGAPESMVREEAARVAQGELTALRTYLTPLDQIATLSPLLGLLGTVIGMIEAFQALQAAGSQVDPGVLSGGIWQALMTTAVGLAVAIPATIAHGWLESRLEQTAQRMDDLLTRVFTAPLASARDMPVAQDDTGFVIPDAT